MRKNELVMAILLAILMVTGCLFHPLAAYYNFLRCIHSVAALALIVCVIIHVKKRAKLLKKKEHSYDKKED